MSNLSTSTKDKLRTNWRPAQHIPGTKQKLRPCWSNEADSRTNITFWG